MSIVSLSGLVFVIFFGMPQNDVLVCETKHGDQYILKSKYIWTPLNPNPVHPSVRNSQDDYSVFFKRKNSDRWKNTNTTIQYIQIDAPDSAESLCAKVAVKNTIPLVFLSFMNKNDQWYSWPHDFPESLYTYARDGIKPFIQKQLDTIDGATSHYQEARVMPIGNQLIYELPIINKGIRDNPTYENTKIIAVFASVSKDNGKNRSVLKLKLVPSIFETGKLYMSNHM